MKGRSRGPEAQGARKTQGLEAEELSVGDKGGLKPGHE